VLGTQTGAGRVCDGVRGDERARKVTSSASGEVGRDRGDAAGIAADPGSTPWVAASTAPAVGSRKYVWVSQVARRV
jgi:hypothetical protein